MDKKTMNILLSLEPQQEQELADLYIYKIMMLLTTEISDKEFLKAITKTLDEYAEKNLMLLK